MAVGVFGLEWTDVQLGSPYIVPNAIIVFLWASDFDPLVRHVEGVDQLPVRQEESHEVVLLGIRHIEDESKR